MSPQLATSILIVEDERIVAKDLQQTLDEMGYDAFAIAASGDEAMAFATEKRPDVVLMDIRIKGPNDGIQTAALLKKRFPVIVIFLTAHTDETMIDRAKRTEPEGYLVKPVKDAELRSMIEIAMHRREIEAARERLRASEHRLHTVTDNVPVSIAYFDREGRVQFANRVFRELVPYRDDPVGVPAKSFLGEALFRASYPPRQRALAGEQVSFVAHVEQKGTLREIEVTYLPDHAADGSVCGVYAIGYDVTEREQLTTQLNQARTDLETILNNVPAGVTSWRVDLTNRFANQTAELRFGITPGAAIGRPMREIFGEQRFQAAEPYLRAAFEGERCSFELADRRADDSLRYHREHLVPEIKEGAVIGLYSLSFDVTELRRSHEQIRDLAQRLETVREEERRAVATILHDGIAQDLFAMKLGLNHLEAMSRRRSAVQRVVKELTSAITKCMESTRQVANDLRPSALGYFDVATVIIEHARHFSERSNLKISVVDSADFPKLDEPIQLLLFRAAQEALTNVARHAQATSVEITLRADDERITMEIVDDGVGMDETARPKPRSLGLLGLAERFADLGGGLAIRRREPHGTALTVYLPRNPRTEARGGAQSAALPLRAGIQPNA
jgi:PAS domain S-box-containing protein